MIPRRSSGSSLADSAVEATTSQNVTVSWRRSAEAAVGSRATTAAVAFTSGLTTEPIFAMELRMLVDDLRSRYRYILQSLVIDVSEQIHIDVIGLDSVRILTKADRLKPLRISFMP
jgi:hypothetical protein